MALVFLTCITVLKKLEANLSVFSLVESFPDCVSILLSPIWGLPSLFLKIIIHTKKILKVSDFVFNNLCNTLKYILNEKLACERN